MTYPDEVLVGSTIQPAHIHETRFSMSYTAWSLRHSRTVATGYGQVGPNVRAHHEPSHSVRMCAQHEPFHSVVVSCQPAGGGYRSDVDDALKHKRRINLSVQACLPFPFPSPLPMTGPHPHMAPITPDHHLRLRCQESRPQPPVIARSDTGYRGRRFIASITNPRGPRVPCEVSTVLHK